MKTFKASFPVLFVLILGLLPHVSQAAELPLLTIQQTEGSQQVSVSLQVLVLMTLLTLLPSLLLTMTSFTRIIIVLAILRQAIGMQQTPSNQILVGLALFMSFFTMAPVLQQVNQDAIQPYVAEAISPVEALDRAVKPFKRFMLAQTRASDLVLFHAMAHRDQQEPLSVDNLSPEDVSLWELLPAFVTSELKTAFQIGFLLFIPFLVIDLVIASVLMAMGMMMLSPMIISLPFKIMLFVLVDGWALVMGSLANSFVEGT
jgi:flagellar biosynthetic protein FliP